MKYIVFFIAACLAVSCGPVYGQDTLFAGYEHLFTPPRQYIACPAGEDIRIDGKLTESSWHNAAWSDYFSDIEGNSRPAPALKTRFKLLWDAQYIYIAAELEEPDIWATIKEHDAVIFHDNDFEIFLDPDGDTHNYFEIEVNAFNTIFDLFLSRPYRNGGPALPGWDVQQLRSAVFTEGSINHAKDTDKKWSVEMAIPFSSLSLTREVQAPKDRAVWRINFSRVEWDIEKIKGVYVKKTDTVTHHHLAEHNWVWSPQGIINMHYPERWGYLHFSTQNSGAAKTDQPLPVAEQVKKYLWLLYYKQQEYRKLHKNYATTLSELDFPSLMKVDGLDCSFYLEATSSQFNAVVRSATGDENWQINQEGKINKAKNP